MIVERETVLSEATSTIERPPAPADRLALTRGRLGFAVLMAALGVLVGFDAWADIFHLAARDEESSHIFLVPIVIAWLVWVRRQRIRHLRPHDFWIGPVMVALSWAMMYVGEWRLWQSVWHAGAIGIVVGAFLSVTGLPTLRAFLPAFLVLVFMVPVPGRVRQQIAMPMQNTTAALAEGFFELTDTSVTRSGNLLRINGVDVAVAEACNGQRMVFALTLVCYAFAFGNPLRPWVRVLIVLASPVVAIICNVVRLIPTVYAYGYLSTEQADLFHDVSGWVMLFAAFFILMGILRVLRWSMVPVQPYTLAHD